MIDMLVQHVLMFNCEEDITPYIVGIRLECEDKGIAYTEVVHLNVPRSFFKSKAFT